MRTKEEYQKALNELSHKASIVDWMHDDHPRYDEAVEHTNKNTQALQELIDDKTPKKPLMYNGFPKCPVCFNFLIADSYGGYYKCCQDCGCEIDWSKDEI